MNAILSTKATLAYTNNAQKNDIYVYVLLCPCSKKSPYLLQKHFREKLVIT